MTEADALATDSTAERIPGTAEVRHGIEQGHASIAGRQRSEPPAAPAVAADDAPLAGLQPPDHTAEPSTA